jgi:cation/acetate symporter
MQENQLDTLVLIAILYTTVPCNCCFCKTNLIETVNEKNIHPCLRGLLNGKQQVYLLLKIKTVTEKFNIIMTHQKMLLLAEQEAKGNKGSEPTIDKDIMVLANPEIADLPNCNCISCCRSISCRTVYCRGITISYFCISIA